VSAHAVDTMEGLFYTNVPTAPLFCETLTVRPVCSKVPFGKLLSCNAEKHCLKKVLLTTPKGKRTRRRARIKWRAHTPTWLDPAQMWQNFKKLLKILRYLIPPRMLHPLPPQVAKIV